MQKKGILLDIDYEDKEEKSVIRLYARSGNKIETIEEKAFKPYFYAVVDSWNKEKELLKEVKIAKIFRTQKTNAEKVLKLEFDSTKDLKNAREAVGKIKGLQKREHDIPFAKRYLIDKGLELTGLIEFNGKISKTQGEKNLKLLAFDLETFAPKGRFSDPKKDPILMISIADEKESLVLSWSKEMQHLKGVKVYESEKEMIKSFKEIVVEKSPDVIITYNGDLFDFPYIKERARNFSIKLEIGAGKTEPKIVRKGTENAAKLKGVQHVDAYQIVRLLSVIGSINPIKYDLETVHESIFKESKTKLSPQQINEYWETGKNAENLVEYNKEDSESVLRITKEFLPLYLELCKLVKLTLFDCTRGSTGTFVEQLLNIKSFEKNYLIPLNPSEKEINTRYRHRFEGAFVKEPLPGLHEDIAIVDFRTYHASIMVAHNISTETLNCKCCEKEKPNLSPTGSWYCGKKKGFLASTLEEVIKKRAEAKEKMKKAKKGSVEYSSLYASQWALKTLIASFYGYMGYPRSRWYSREIVNSVYAWVRKYIKEAVEKAESSGLIPLYSDTDSLFLKIPKNKSRKDVEEFVAKINKEIPKGMELELEGFYKRGIFVTKKEGGAAKKRYALIDEEGNLKITGFEYVRRDWSRIAKETQKAVIEAILKEGKTEKAVEIVKEKIEELKKGIVTKKDLVVYTQIQKPLNKYEAIGPHISAALKAEKKGVQVGEGSIIGYIITKTGKSISDKAELEEFVKEGNYDAEYYIKNQVVPAVIKIMKELGHTEEDLIEGGKQKTLGSYS